MLFKSDDGKIKLYNGDFFNFNSKHEKFDCVWDRGALVALPEEQRKRLIILNKIKDTSPLCEPGLTLKKVNFRSKHLKKQ